MKLRKLFSILLALTMVLGSGSAFAASVTGSVLPAAMISAGEGEITVAITNDNPVPAEGEEGINITDIFVYSEMYPELSFSGSGKVAPGETGKVSGKFFFAEELIGVGIPLTVSYIEGGEAKTKSLEVSVQRTKTSAVTVTRVASSKQASPGEEITLTYTVTNTGDHAVQVTSIVDRRIAGKESFHEGFTLEAGQYLEIPYTYKMGSSTVESAPVVTYKDSLSGETLTAEASPISLGMINAKISVEVIQGEATANGVVFTLNLTNNGNQRVSEIKIIDDLGNRVNPESFSLAVGESKQLTYTVVTDTERYVVFNISGVTSSKDAYEDNTKSYVVRKYIDPSLLGIEFSAVVTETLNSAGSIGVQFNVNNTGSMTMTGLVISEETVELDENGAEKKKLTELYRTDSIAPGLFTTTQTVYVGEPRDLTFVVEIADPAGNPYTYTAHVTAATLGVRDTQDTATSQQNAIDALGTTIGQSVNRALTTALIVLGVLTVLSVIAMIVLTALEKKQRREAARRRAMRERQQRRTQQSGGRTTINKNRDR